MFSQCISLGLIVGPYIVQVTAILSTLRFCFILKRPHVAWSRSYSSFRQISRQIKFSQQIEFDQIFPTNVSVWGEGGRGVRWATRLPCPPVVTLLLNGITISLIYIYWTRAQVVGSGFCSPVVEHWSSNPEDAGSIPSRKALKLHFSQLVNVSVL